MLEVYALWNFFALLNSLKHCVCHICHFWVHKQYDISKHLFSEGTFTSNKFSRPKTGNHLRTKAGRRSWFMNILFSNALQNSFLTATLWRGVSQPMSLFFPYSLSPLKELCFVESYTCVLQNEADTVTFSSVQQATVHMQAAVEIASELCNMQIWSFASGFVLHSAVLRCAKCSTLCQK